MVKANIGKNYVVFKLEGAQRFLALKNSVKIPLVNIESISTEKVKPVFFASRIGTHIPGGFMAGTFWIKEGKTFYYVKNKSKCLTLKLKNHEYSKVIFEVDNKETFANNLRKAINNRKI